ncbi:hypothetical protein [Porphyrobacter sp. ULC335]|jgi:hypothetical protein|uniref:hypothetical protein n=1 Tax=Porphyrobacter sp. ULC335 TaxID=2854260 RepID=UPI00221E8A3E|nr:hypothetical protein [Porphyrobacter sp. ULC335]UYV14732.1 hypothetical protein KVF90_11315 [Porphyrobacter sp. ULC335]
MSHLPDQFIVDRALRDAARAVLTDDIERLRANLSEEGIASRVSSGVTSTISGRIRTGARDVLAQAKAQAGDHKGVLAVLLGAILLWIARGPILDWIDEFDATEDEDNDDTASPDAVSEGDPE